MLFPFRVVTRLVEAVGVAGATVKAAVAHGGLCHVSRRKTGKATGTVKAAVADGGLCHVSRRKTGKATGKREE